jgi:2-keto-4-pentenoate hydratase/2-oxohepta-3-ene-1,7-dioic acid hydratase in catechol pathway
MRIARALIDGQMTFGELDGGRFHCLIGDVFSAPLRTEKCVAVDEVTLLSPVQPARILLVLGGFMPKDGSPLPPQQSWPRLTSKIVGGVSGDGGVIVVPPSVTTKLWIEVELAVVIGDTVRAADRAQAAEAIWGFTCFNDATAPEFIFDLEAGRLLEQPDYFRSKSIDTFASMGPCVRTDLSEQQIAQGLRLAASVNGELRAEGTTRRQRFSVTEVISFVSHQTTLRRGDVIALGTPQPCLAGPGDLVDLEIEGIGSLRNRIAVAELGPDPPAEESAI